MNSDETKKLIEALHAGLGQPYIAVRCWCDNLETVFLLVDENGQLCVTDNHETFHYLATAGDKNHVSFNELDMNVVSQICESAGVTLTPETEEDFPSLEIRPSSGQDISEAIERVANAIDAIFELSAR